jgi:hypothetical protein
LPLAVQQTDPVTDPSRIVRAVAGALVVGLVLGFLTQYLEGELSGKWGTLATSDVVWVIVAFMVAAAWRLRAGWSAVLGFVTLVAALTGYYVSARLIDGVTSSASAIAVWVLAALVAGPVFGVAGSWWSADGAVRSTGSWLSAGGGSERAEARLWHLSRSVVAVALLSAALLAEGIHYLWRVEGEGAAGQLELVAAVVAPLALAHSGRDRVTGLLLLIPLGLLGVAAYGLLDALLAG